MVVTLDFESNGVGSNPTPAAKLTPVEFLKEFDGRFYLCYALPSCSWRGSSEAGTWAEEVGLSSNGGKKPASLDS
jgi:hypothetical protein